MYNENLISKDEAIVRIEPLGLDKFLHTTKNPDFEKNIITKVPGTMLQ